MTGSEGNEANKDEIERVKLIFETVKGLVSSIIALTAIAGIMSRIGSGSQTPAFNAWELLIFSVALLATVLVFIMSHVLNSRIAASCLKKLTAIERSDEIRELRKTPYFLFSVISLFSIVTWLLSIFLIVF